MTSEQETIQETETAGDATKSSTELAEKAGATSGNDAPREHVDGSVSDHVSAELSERRDQLIKEAVDALAETKVAIEALHEGNKQDAIDALARVTGKLETVVAREPDLAMAPVAADYRIVDLIATPETVRDIGILIEHHVRRGDFQIARSLMRDFASEIVIELRALPLKTYPDAILEATRLIDEGKTEAATTILNTALSTVAVVETVVPLPTVRAKAMISKAKALQAGEASDADGKPSLDDYIEGARVELEIAEALGYGRKKDFKDLHNAIADLKKSLKDRKEAAGIFSKIADHFEDLKARLFDASR